MDVIAKEKKAREERNERDQKVQEEEDAEQRQFMEEHAARILEDAQTINLGRNIGDQKDEKAPVSRRKKDISGAPLTGDKMQLEDGQPKKKAKLSKKEKKAMKKQK